MAKKVFGSCALCQQSKELRDSHIISLMFFKDVCAEPYGLEISVDVDKFNKRNRKGYHEHLLCGDCESRVNIYENEASRIVRNAAGVTFTKVSDDIGQVNGLDYTRFKLFQLSILWRMSVSKLPIFADVKLGNNEETLRLMILNGDAGEVADYGCNIEARLYEGESASQFFSQPTHQPIELPNGEVVSRYETMFGGYVWHFFVARSAKIPPFISKLFLQKDGSFYLAYEELMEMDSFKQTIAEMVLAERKRAARKHDA
ncbi:hypothetical protein PQU92_08760 [Asticcacaulis sp. BYS171W]|uniref:HNH endonuclease n=1 Tax=Asticcacaulis aquaticus TaxID=2984212 RepID=A0ABT5HTH3_9CAUL|nr:hypothetical protein [Asticcacaulis aquaticus]MDC7683365.1 hypothetical protein [Asticcacaulis aquaticus]